MNAGAIVETKTVSWINNAVANTLPSELTFTRTNDDRYMYHLEIDNPSTETDLIIEIYKVVGEQDYFLTMFAAPKKTTRPNGKSVQRIIKEMYVPFAGTNQIKIAVSNDQVIGAAGAFTATLTLREVI